MTQPQSTRQHEKITPRTPPERAVAPASDELERLDAYWRAANYLSVGQIYLLDNQAWSTRTRTASRRTASTEADHS